MALLVYNSGPVAAYIASTTKLLSYSSLPHRSLLSFSLVPLSCGRRNAHIVRARKGLASRTRRLEKRGRDRGGATTEAEEEGLGAEKKGEKRGIPLLPAVLSLTDIFHSSSQASMELEQEGGNSLSLEVGSPTLIGRELGSRLGLSSSDRTISRCHVSLQLMHPVDAKDDFNDVAEELLLQFEVIGKNPILVCSRGGGCKRVYRKSEKGVLKAGDCISLSIKNPVLYVVKRREGGKAEVDASVLDAVARRERRTLQRRKEAEERAKLEEDSRGDDEEVREGSEPEIGYLEISEIDPVKEFGFLVRGHEFDQYPSRMIRPFKNWNLFLEDTGGGRGDDNEEYKAVSTKLKGRHQKKKKGDDSDDEDWIEVSDNEKTLAAKTPSAKRPRYSTRSKNPKKVCSDTQSHKRPANKKLNSQQTELDDEDDETLGGFIVGDNDLEEEVEEEEEEEEEVEEEEEE